MGRLGSCFIPVALSRKTGYNKNIKGKADCRRHHYQAHPRCGEALRQIEENRYEETLRQEGYQDILKYGVAFYRKDCMVKMAEIVVE